MTSLNPYHAAKLSIFLKAAGVDRRAEADEQYVARLMTLQRHAGCIGRICMLAFSATYSEDGHRDMAATGLCTPNRYVLELHSRFAGSSWPCGSVHPYNRDGLAQLGQLADQGVRMIKWLPNSMNINPSDRRCRPFYELMAARGIVLLCHTGNETSVDAGGVDNALGNPLRLRAALDAGVTVIAAHCATEGENLDLDWPGDDKPTVENFDLFIRLMGESRYDGLLFGDISAIIAFRRVGRYTADLLERRDLHHRLVYGSDYPVPCVNMVVHTHKLARLGFLTSEQADQLNEIYRYNPLLYDLGIKRCLRSPNNSEIGFPPEVFTRSLYGARPADGVEPLLPQPLAPLEEGAFAEATEVQCEPCDGRDDSACSPLSINDCNVGAGSGLSLDLSLNNPPHASSMAPPRRKKMRWSLLQRVPMPCFISHALQEFNDEAVVMDNDKPG